MVGPVAKRRAASFLAQQESCSERQACRLIGFSRGTYRREPVKHTQDRRIRTRLHILARQHLRYGYRRMHALLRQEGTMVAVCRFPLPLGMLGLTFQVDLILGGRPIGQSYQARIVGERT